MITPHFLSAFFASNSTVLRAFISSILFLIPTLTESSVLNASQHPWYVIGKLRVQGAKSCTATLIGPNTIITAAHCIYNRKNKRYYAPKSIQFMAGFQHKSLVARSIATSYTVASKNLPDGQFDEQALLTDWALIKLKEPVGCMLGSLKTGKASEYLTYNLIAAGYPISTPSKLTAETQCEFALPPRKGKMIRLKNCAVEHGDSGAPLIATQGKSSRLLGIISAGTNDSKGRYRAVAVPSEQFQKQVIKDNISCDNLVPNHF